MDNPVSGKDITLYGVWGISENNVFAVGQSGTVLNYEHTQITTTSSTTTTASSQPCTSETIYGEQSTETELLRSLRDNILSQTPEGREIINLYYQCSPAIVKAMEEDEEFGKVVKKFIDDVLFLIIKQNKGG